MNIELVRFIDRFIGIPACFVLSGIRNLFLWKTKRPEENLPKKILFVELSEMGSAILAYPAMQYALKRYPGADLYFLIFEQNRFSVDLLEIMPQDHVFTISTRTAWVFLKSTLEAIRAIRSTKINTLLDLELFSRFSALLTGLSGAQIRAGFSPYLHEGLYRGNLFTHPVLYNCHQHMAKNFLALVKSIERGPERPLLKEVINEPLTVPRYHPAEEEKAVMLGRLAQKCPSVKSARHLVLLNPSAGTLLPIRAWPLENYIDLAKRILVHFNAVIVITGLPEAADEADAITREVGKETCIDMAGKTSIPELFALLSHARLLITADSGPAHFAALTDTPNIVLFGPETPVLYAPLGANVTCLFAGLACSPCLSAYNHRKTACRDPQCMRAISVDQVFDTIRKTLEK